MTWASVTMRWPAQATRWLDDLSNAQKLAGGELASTTKRMRDLQGLATTNPGRSARRPGRRYPPGATRWPPRWARLPPAWP